MTGSSRYGSGSARVLRVGAELHQQVVGLASDFRGFPLLAASTSGTMTVTPRMVRDWDYIHRRAAECGWYANTVDYRHGSYWEAPDVEATWFIDPPYQYANRRGYKYGASTIDFERLKEFVLSRRGQVIVCEQEGADWMPFMPLGGIVTHRGSVSREVVWTPVD